MNIALSVALVLLISVMSMVIVLSIGSTALSSATSSSQLIEAENMLRIMDNYISEAKSESEGSMRIVKLTFPGEFLVNAIDNSVQFKANVPAEMFEYGSRIIDGNIARIGGADASCSVADADSDGDNDLIMENSYVKLAFQRVERASPLSAIDTKNNIAFITEKTRNATVQPVNSSVVIDNNMSTSTGNGYSEISRTANNLPACTVHFYIERSDISYDIYYTLYAYADFVVAEVRNIRVL